MKRNEFAWTANMLTAGNLLLGFWAIIQILDGHYMLASWLIVSASILDGLDGKLARFTKGASEIGTEFDSLADAVSFGAAPAVLLYAVSFHNYGFAGIALAALQLIFGVARLARFNKTATTGEKKAYEGLPIPISASAIATFIVFNYTAWGTLRLEILLIPLTIGLALLMVSHIPYDAMPRFSFRESSANLLKLMAIITAVILTAFNPGLVFFPLIVIYILKGLTLNFFHGETEEDEFEEILGD